MFLFAYVNLLVTVAAAVRFTIEPVSVVTGEEEPAPIVCAVEGLNYSKFTKRFLKLDRGMLVFFR